MAASHAPYRHPEEQAPEREAFESRRGTIDRGHVRPAAETTTAELQTVERDGRKQPSGDNEKHHSRSRRSAGADKNHREQEQRRDGEKEPSRHHEDALSPTVKRPAPVAHVIRPRRSES